MLGLERDRSLDCIAFGVEGASYVAEEKVSFRMRSRMLIEKCRGGEGEMMVKDELGVTKLGLPAFVFTPPPTRQANQAPPPIINKQPTPTTALLRTELLASTSSQLSSVCIRTIFHLLQSGLVSELHRKSTFGPLSQPFTTDITSVDCGRQDIRPRCPLSRASPRHVEPTYADCDSYACGR